MKSAARCRLLASGVSGVVFTSTCGEDNSVCSLVMTPRGMGPYNVACDAAPLGMRGACGLHCKGCAQQGCTPATTQAACRVMQLNAVNPCDVMCDSAVCPTAYLARLQVHAHVQLQVFGHRLVQRQPVVLQRRHTVLHVAAGQGGQWWAGSKGVLGSSGEWQRNAALLSTTVARRGAKKQLLDRQASKAAVHRTHAFMRADQIARRFGPR